MERARSKFDRRHSSLRRRALSAGDEAAWRTSHTNCQAHFRGTCRWGDPATSPLDVFGPFLNLLFAGGVTAVFRRFGLVGGADRGHGFGQVPVMKWVTEGTGGSTRGATARSDQSALLANAPAFACFRVEVEAPRV